VPAPGRHWSTRRATTLGSPRGWRLENAWVMKTGGRNDGGR